ncbi:hypothetical protein K490DRAFT_70653 [Saccharata proteae CBS 121410]|uniref:Palmitoyltransferase AKR1 n=1 Tax=Saccharata proteae CBS 121410 TaxID=1314787 RepID=A0A9P4I3A3_9PEZI|nr:hypothetical protein K490DRAFT_70653 [Saccharata proteae CBS 121410]
MSSSSTNESPATGDQHVELKDMGAQDRPSLPIEEDIMQLARLGEIAAIQKLFDSGKFDASYRDEQGITPLHWAAINNHYALCHFLLNAGADVNARGGDAVATPVLWAAKRCNYYVVALLLSKGADPLLTDDQGFNLLHSATLDGNVFQLVLLLHQDIQVDIPDAQGHTALMWAAYKGFPAVVEVLVRWGANVYAKDDQGFTALHWALVKGSVGCIQKLLEYGSDRFAENNEGKTPAITAQDMNSTRQWHRALSDAGYNPDGTPKYFPLQSIVKDRRWFLNKFFFLWPFLVLISTLYILSHMVIYAAVPIALFVGYGLQWLAQQLLTWAPSDMKHIHKTPFLAGVFAGTLFWVGVRYITHILPWTIYTNPFMNALFIISYTLCGYFYFMTMIADPGYVPKNSSRASQKAVIDELLEARKYDEQNYCVHCMVRRPVRSKHCKRCNRCVAKEDHHCPWVDNCVANNNHRHFVLYVAALEVGVLALLRLVLSYLENIPSPPEPPSCNILAPGLCEILSKDPYTITLAFWASLQLVWVTMLLVVQLLQVARAQTTFEAMRSNMHGHGAGDAVTSFVTTGAMSAEGGQVNPEGSGPSAAASPPHRPQKQGFLEQWKKLLGLDTFIATALHGSRANEVMAQRRQNPYTRGFVRNCKDFWCVKSSHGPLAEYEARVASGRLRDDEHQRTLIQNLDALHDNVAKYNPPAVVHPTIESLQPPKKNFLSSLFSKQEERWDPKIPATLPKGLYMYGDVGSGKTMLMDLFYDTLPPNIKNKKRIHFHNFMQEVHRELHKAKMAYGNDIDVIPFVAADIAAQSSVLCFDEFQCTDVADAMILRRLIESLMAHGVVLVTTSNRHPDELYKNGIQRESFIPCIKLLKSRLRVINLDSQTDYRKIPRPPSGVYHHPLDAMARTHAERWFRFLGDFENDPPKEARHMVWGREISVPKASGKAAMFTFNEIIGRATGAADYLELMRNYEAFIVTDVPGMNLKSRDLARRFITFIDAIYESRAKLVLTTAVPLQELFVDHDELAEAQREGGVSGTKKSDNQSADEAIPDAMRSLMDDLGMDVSTLKNTSIFSGDEERFAFARAMSRLVEMGSQEWVERGMGLEKLGGKKEKESWQRVRSKWREDSM